MRRQAPQPLVKRDVLENVSGEQLQEYRVGVPSVLDIMRGVGGYIADGRVFHQHLGRRVRHPFREQHGAAFREIALVEDKQELGAIRVESLN
jgi:hypothetical protein